MLPSVAKAASKVNLSDVRYSSTCLIFQSNHSLQKSFCNCSFKLSLETITHTLITLLASSNISLKTDLVYGNNRKYFEVACRRRVKGNRYEMVF